MSEEEQKAIKTAKCIRAGVPVQTCDDDYIVLLNIIENQQKEIEEKNIAINKMSKDISHQLKEIERLNFENHMLKKWNEQLDKNCISKDKIREKIKEITNYDYTSIEERECQLYARQVLKELLEEN